MAEINATPPGWYYAEGDPPGTQRYWDGATWQGGPQPVASPGGVPHVAGSKLADPGKRILARGIDYVVWFIIMALAGSILGLGVSNLQTDGLAIGTTLFGGSIGVAGVIAYEALMLGSRGQTLGKMALNTKVVRLDGAPLGFADGAKRTALFIIYAVPILGPFVAMVLGLVSTVLLFNDNSRQAIWDKVSKTVVVEA